MNMKAVRAKEWLADPVFLQLWADMEAAAVNRAVYAKPTENEKRDEALAEIRVIRALQSTLKALAYESEANSIGNAAPA